MSLWSSGHSQSIGSGGSWSRYEERQGGVRRVGVHTGRLQHADQSCKHAYNQPTINVDPCLATPNHIRNLDFVEIVIWDRAEITLLGKIVVHCGPPLYNLVSKGVKVRCESTSNLRKTGGREAVPGDR